MKNYLRLTGLLFGLVCMAATTLAQTEPAEWADVIIEERGDTAVVKPSSMAPGYFNTLFYAIMWDPDTSATGELNPKRVYETLRGHAYIYDKESTIDSRVPRIHIWAKPGTDQPPIHYKTLNPKGDFKKAFYKMAGGNAEFYMENQYLMQALIEDSRDRNWFRKLGDNMRIEFKNCIVEESNWAWITMAASGTTIKVTDCLIMNIGAESSLEKGNIYDGKIPLDTVWFENNTMLNCGNFMIVRDGAAPNFLYFNHNTLVNHLNNPFYFYAQGEQIVTNNIFMNTGFVPDYPGFYPFYQDADKLPKGIINVDTVDNAWKENFWGGNYPFEEADRKILVDRNSASWDSRLQDMFDNDLVSDFPDTIDEVWASQMITMNTRTQAMFDDDAAYSYFNEGHWYTTEPDFANNEDKVPEWAEYVVSQAIPGAPNSGLINMDTTNWRTNWKTDLVQPDWPILPDLSYTDGELASGGVKGYPLGDLNWFPSRKASWEGSNESAVLIAAMKSGSLPDYPVGIKEDKVMDDIAPQVSAYPNPLSSTTTVRFEIASATDAQLIVYNIIGERVRVMELGHRSAGMNEVTLDRDGLASGMYILQINTDYNKAGLTTKISIK